MKTLLIMPTYNEIENLRPLLAEIFAYAPFSQKYGILVGEYAEGEN